MTKVPPQAPVHVAGEPLPARNQLKIELEEGASLGEKIVKMTVLSPEGAKLAERTYAVNAAITNHDDELY